jgi:hypothetical protein
VRAPIIVSLVEVVVRSEHIQLVRRDLADLGRVRIESATDDPYGDISVGDEPHQPRSFLDYRNDPTSSSSSAAPPPESTSAASPHPGVPPSPHGSSLSRHPPFLASPFSFRFARVRTADRKRGYP